MNSHSKKYHHIVLFIFNCTIDVRCYSSQLASILIDVYGAMQIDKAEDPPVLNYTIRVELTDELDQNNFIIEREGCDELVTQDISEFIFFFEKDMTIELQKIRSDLLFIHSAVVEFEGAAMLLVAPSGTGKSTTTWALLNNGFSYLSDELAPIDLTTMTIHPYPHAINLKARPPMYDLPDGCLFTSQTIHVPSTKYSNSIQFKPAVLKAIVFLEYNQTLSEPEISRVSTAQASAKLYANSLNILAHSSSDYGMMAAIKIASEAQNFQLYSNRLDKTCEKIKSMLVSL